MHHKGLCGKQRAASWALSIIVAVILVQTLFFKFTGAEESVYIFTKLGAEPWGRIGSGVAELIASILILVPATRLFGAGLSLGVIMGAIMSHLTVLGIVVKDDGGTLFVMAMVVALASAGVIYFHRLELLLWIKRGRALVQRT
ncbi:DoxX family protein [bacterium]|nr:DoxX family protein [bacterium]